MPRERPDATAGDGSSRADAGKMVHFRVAYDAGGRRVSDRLSHVPVVGQMLQTIEAKPSATGTKFTIYYSVKPGVPLADENARPLFLDSVRQRTEGDVRGMKALCEAEARVLQAAPAES